MEQSILRRGDIVRCTEDFDRMYKPEGCERHIEKGDLLLINSFAHPFFYAKRVGSELIYVVDSLRKVQLYKRPEIRACLGDIVRVRLMINNPEHVDLGDLFFESREYEGFKPPIACFKFEGEVIRVDYSNFPLIILPTFLPAPIGLPEYLANAYNIVKHAEDKPKELRDM